MADLRPISKIQIYNNAPALLHTIENKALPLSITPRVTSGVGTFNFVLPRGSGTDWTTYNDVLPYYDAYIWLDYDSFSPNPRMRGKITSINDVLSEDGALVSFQGKDYGEVLQRLLKTKYWEGETAHNIVDEICDDCGLGKNHVAADATALDYDAVDKSYFDILQDISEIRNKDWYVAYCYTHNAKELWWFARQPAVSTITLEEGLNINSYSLLRDINPVRNDITVYGARLLTAPTDKDTWTQTTTFWTGTFDTVTTNVDAAMGTKSIQFDRAASQNIIGIYDWAVPSDILSAKFPHEYRNLHFALKYVAATGNPGTLSIRLRKDAANYFFTILYPEFHNMAIGGDWVHFTIPLGRETESSSGMNNEWNMNGTLDWDELDEFWFMPSFTGVGQVTVRIDELYLGEARVVGTASDAGSQTSYGTRQIVVIDDVMSSSAVSDYATYLNNVLHDPITELDILSKGELDLQVGDQVPIEIPSKAISTNYDLIQVTQTLNQNGLTSRSILSSRAEHRSRASFRDLASYMANLTQRVEKVSAGRLFK